MKKLTAFTLSAAMVPALALGTVAFAVQASVDGQDDDLRAGEQYDDEQRAGDEQGDDLRAGEQYDDEQRASEDRDDELRAGDERDDELRAGDERDDDELRAGDERDDDELRAGDERDDELRAGDERDDEQLAGQQDSGQQFMDRKPPGALFADDVIGKTVKTRGSGDDIGTIDDLVIGDDGRILGAVVTTGGFLGLGGQEVSVGWDNIQHSMEDDDSVFYVDMDEETLKSAPELERD